MSFAAVRITFMLGSDESKTNHGPRVVTENFNYVGKAGYNKEKFNCSTLLAVLLLAFYEYDHHKASSKFKFLY